MKIPLSGVIDGKGILKYHGLYKIVNTQNGHWYIGSTIMGLAKRMSRHRNALRQNKHGNPHLQNAYNKYGENSFVFIILKRSPLKSFIKEEQKIIDLHFGKEYFYNISKDASAPMTGRCHSPESIIKLRVASQKRAKEIGECTRRRQLGTKHSKKTIKKMKASALKRDDSKRIAILKSIEVREKISKTTKGRKRPPEYHEKMKIIRQSAKYRKKLSLATRGIKKSDTMKSRASFARLGKSIVLTREDGLVEEFISLRSFERKYGMDRKEISKVVKGIKESHKGWKLLK